MQGKRRKLIIILTTAGIFLLGVLALYHFFTITGGSQYFKPH